MIPVAISRDATAERICAIAAQWNIDPDLSWRLHALACRVSFQFSIISGYRTEKEQTDLRNDPKYTAADDDRSTHRSNPATGADIRPAGTITLEMKKQLGAAAADVGLRWGGGAPRSNGVPGGHEWAHLDLGPRTT